VSAVRGLLARAIAARRAGHRAAARDAVQAALGAAPRDAEALHLAAVIAHEDGRSSEALRLIDRALAVARYDPRLHRARGIIAHALGRDDEAIAAFRRVHEAEKRDVESVTALAQLLVAARRLEEAADALGATADLVPDAGLDFERGNLLRELGRLEAAADAYARGRKRAPADVRILSNLAMTLVKLGRHAEAKEAFAVALKLKLAPRDGARLANAFASFLKSIGDEDAAREYFETAVALDPDEHAYRLNLAEVSALQGTQPWHLSLALAGRPDLDARLPIGSFEPLAMSLLYVDETGRRQRDFLRRAHLGATGPVARLPPPDRSRERERRLRVGYLSPDFRRHAVGSFILPVLEAHDRDVVDLFAYAQLETPDDISERIRASCTGWTVTNGLDDAALAERIRADAIDVLVDLAGLTSNHRLGAVRRRPAPVQLTWIGYPATTGLDCFDARLTDAVADPPGMTEEQFSEPLERLRTSFLAYRPLDDVPAPRPLEARPGVIFGSFNYVAKISATSWRLWAGLLGRVPNSRLRLKSLGLERPMVAQEVRARARMAGIDLERLDLLDFTATQDAHFAAYDDIDVALDTFPYNGTTTTCEALWMGVPVVTLAGRTHHSRVGASLLHHAGLDDLVAGSEDEYVELAARLAADRARRDEWRAALRGRVAASALCDGRAVASAAEDAYRRLWRRWCDQSTLKLAAARQSD
jgi:predicted O-linked N-acetylglucosamine transferase (SPINDLY family)